ncbi:MAG: thiamine pyrophosphate-binding protein [Zoogloeaceae bacterium]|jgi:acetolactate synthase-1/2/3 large subunit|nr:thiamine pyrophosphate-binding protein [Zoogloeaceae bacterium]
MRVADYLMHRLAHLGIRQVFFLPGGGAMHLNDALGRHPDLTPVLCLTEQAAGIAAEAAGKYLSGPAACLTTSGPGATNAVTAVLGAWLDSTPVFFLSGQVKSADLKAGTKLRMRGVQEADIVSIVSSITKAAVTLTDPASVAETFDHLEHAALTGRRGPVWLDVPLDVQAAEIDPDTLPRARHDVRAGPAPADLLPAARQTLALLQSARRPALIAGAGIRMAGAAQEFQRLYETTRIPVLPTWLGMDLIADDHPLYAGRPGSIAPRYANFTLQNADCLVILGARLDMAMTAYDHARFAPQAQKIVVEIDPAEIAKLEMPIALPVVADVGAFLQALHTALDEAPAQTLPGYDDWLARIAGWKARYPLLRPEHADDRQGISLYTFTDCLSERLTGEDLIAPGSSGFASELFLLNLRLKAGQRCFHNRGTGSMGFGLPAAIGACLASGGRRTICVEGDGGFQMNAQELATLARENLPVKCFVVNNRGYASIRASQSANFGRLTGADATSGLKLPDLSRLAAAYDVPYTRIERHADLKTHLNDILTTPGPLLCELVAQADEARIPRVMTRLNVQGQPESSPLEDLYPFLDREELRANMECE